MHKILIVDDEISIRECFKLALLRRGLDVITAQDGSEGLIEYQEHKPQVVITDLQMNPRTGFWLIKQLEEFHLTVNVIVVSGCFYDERCHALNESSIVKCMLSKPVDLDLLYNTIAEFLSS